MIGGSLQEVQRRRYSRDGRLLGVTAGLVAALAALLAMLIRSPWVLAGGLALSVALYVDQRTHRRRRGLAVAVAWTVDRLTRLPSSVLITERLREAVAERPEEDVALLVLDVDRLKIVNDALGQDAGDHVLSTIAHRLEDLVSDDGEVGRLSGDAFAVVLTHTGTSEAAIERIRRLREALMEPIAIGESDLVATVTVGAVAPVPKGERPEVTVDNAFAALNRAKGSRRGYALFHPGVRRRAFERLEIERSMRRAIAEGRIGVAYQPVVSVADGSIVGAEALARWTDPALGPVRADLFIPIAEECGSIVDLGALVMERACKRAASWRAAGVDLQLDVNLSPRELADDGVIDRVAGALEVSGLAPGALCLELTETAVMGDPDFAQARLESLKQLGVRLAIDDFGVGFSSLGLIARMLPIDLIKIDRSFVTDLADGRESAIVKFVIELCEALDLDVVSEGIETEEQAAAVRALGGRFAQGYFFGRPGSPEALEALLGAGSPAANH